MIILSEEKLHNIIIESINNLLLTESQESKSISAAKKLVMQRLGYDEQEADEFVRVKLRSDFTSLRTPEGGKFILGVTRMFCDGELTDGSTISQLNATLKYVASDAHINEYDRNLNELSAQDLIDRFSANIEMDLENDMNEVGVMDFNGNSDYDIVRIDSYKQANEYNQYTYQEDQWCLTYMEEMFDTYTCGGINQIYFCLKRGFENIKPIPSEGCPLDEYGLSMLSVIVNEKGGLVHCTSRWNHSNGGDDNVMDTKQISDVIQTRFYDVFKPNNKWKDALETAMQRLTNGDNPRYVFNWCREFSEGFAVVKLLNKWNFISQTTNEILSPNLWFDDCSDFNDGFARVGINNKYNFINPSGQLVTKLPTADKSIKGKWFDWITGRMINGFAEVSYNKKENFINKNGELLFQDIWFDSCGDFDKEFLYVTITGMYNLINKQSLELLSKKQWFDWIYDFEGELALVKRDFRCNYINKSGEILYKPDEPNQWFDKCGNFREGLARVTRNYKCNFLNQHGQLLTELPTASESIKGEWFDDCGNFDNGITTIKINGKYNYISQSGELLFTNQWFDFCDKFYGDFAIVKVDNKYCFIDKNGNLTKERPRMGGV